MGAFQRCGEGGVVHLGQWLPGLLVMAGRALSLADISVTRWESFRMAARTLDCFRFRMGEIGHVLPGGEDMTF